MKVMMRTILKVVPGKMAEYMEVEEKSKAMASRYGMPPWRHYNCLSGKLYAYPRLRDGVG